MQPASGEAHQFSQIVSLADRGDGTCTAVVNVFVVSSGFTGNPHDIPDEWKASGDVVKLGERMNAIIKNVSENGANRWVLLNYQKQ